LGCHQFDGTCALFVNQNQNDFLRQEEGGLGRIGYVHFGATRRTIMGLHEMNVLFSLTNNGIAVAFHYLQTEFQIENLVVECEGINRGCGSKWVGHEIGRCDIGSISSMPGHSLLLHLTKERIKE
jgi:hypothetical protein